MAFKDIKGQDRPIDILKEQFKNGRIAGGYLFTGQEAIGKRMVATVLAKAVNCRDQGAGFDSCDKCPECIKIAGNQHPDVHILDTADSGSIKIEAVRQLRKDVCLKPYAGRMKFFIINNAHNMTDDASNALLKILEEPAGETAIILISAKPLLLLPTIISRCKRLKFSSLPREELACILQKDYLLDSQYAHFLAYYAEGRIGYALSLKDSEILKEKNRIIDRFVFSSDTSFENITLRERGDISSSLNILAGWFRDLYLLKVGVPHHQLINYDRKEELLRMMGRYTLMDLEGAISSVSDALFYLEHNVNIKLLLSNLKACIKVGG
ncbi:MAG: DNA polymerase III subunit [Candidatus Omnitrophota bacterium]